MIGRTCSATSPASPSSSRIRTRPTLSAAEPDRGRQDQVRAVGLEQIDRADVGSEPLLDQLDDVVERFRRASVLRNQAADFLQGPEQGAIDGGGGFAHGTLPFSNDRAMGAEHPRDPPPDPAIRQLACHCRPLVRCGRSRPELRQNGRRSAAHPAETRRLCHDLRHAMRGKASIPDWEPDPSAPADFGSR